MLFETGNDYKIHLSLGPPVVLVGGWRSCVEPKAMHDGQRLHVCVCMS